jgi:hypothetical protein
MIRYIELPFDHGLDTTQRPAVRRKTCSQCTPFEIPQQGALLLRSQLGWTTRRFATLKTAQAAEPLATCPIGNCRTADTKLVRDLSFRQAPFFKQFSTCQSSFFNLRAGKLFGDPCHNLIVKQL